MRVIENLSGRRRLLPIYQRWRTWPIEVPPAMPLVIAPHPFGIGDGIAVLALAEALRRRIASSSTTTS